MSDKLLHNLETTELEHFRDRLYNNERVRIWFIVIIITLSIVIFVINETFGILTFILGLILVNGIGQSLKREIREKYQVQTDELAPVINHIIKAKNCEKAKNYDEAMGIWEHLGVLSKAAKARELKAEMESVKVAQKVVHGDEISKTEINDSVVSKSNVGGGGSSKAEELREAKALLDEGVIDDDEFKQMKKEILGK